MSKKEFFRSLDPGIFNWNATEVGAYEAKVAGEDDDCYDASAHYYEHGGLKPLRQGDDGTRILEPDSSIYSLTFVCMLDSVRLDKEWDMTKYLADYFFKASMIYCIQMLLIGFVFHQGLSDADGLYFVKPTFNQMTLRLLCSYMFHFGSYREVSESFKRLKFVRRFPERFASEYVVAAFLLTFYQFTASLMIELAHLVFMCRQKNLVQIMVNYVAFAGVAQLDNLYVEATNKMRAAKVVLEATGAQRERLMEALRFDKQQKAEDKAHTFFNMSYEKPIFLRIVIIWYEIARFVYKSFYFYLFPYLILPLSYALFDATAPPPAQSLTVPPPGWPPGYAWPPTNYDPKDFDRI